MLTINLETEMHHLKKTGFGVFLYLFEFALIFVSVFEIGSKY